MHAAVRADLAAVREAETAAHYSVAIPPKCSCRQAREVADWTQSSFGMFGDEKYRLRQL